MMTTKTRSEDDEVQKPRPMMKLNANTVVMALFGVVLALTAIDLGRRWMNPAANPDEALNPDPVGFGVGQQAPDFTLKDAHAAPRTLSSLVKGDTLLTFICGCRKCRTLQTYIAKLRKKMGPTAPAVVSVASIDPDAEQAYLRDVGLPQTILFEKSDGPVNARYKGHPCPRVFRMDAQRKVTYISPSPMNDSVLDVIGRDMAHQLGFRLPGEPPAMQVEGGVKQLPVVEPLPSIGEPPMVPPPGMRKNIEASRRRAAEEKKRPGPKPDETKLPPYLRTPDILNGR
jgi:hypothetical protein